MTDIVTYEQAISLKKAGYSWPCDDYYNSHRELCHYATTDRVNRNTNGHHTPSCSAPSYSEACAWLRRKKGLFLNIWLCAAGWGWVIEKCSTPENRGTFVCRHDDESGDDVDSGLFTTYEKSLSSALDVALKLIVNERLD